MTRPSMVFALPVLVGTVIGMILWLPARLVLSALPAPWGCVHAEGTVWQGRCLHLTIEGREAGAVAWRWRTARLLRGEIAGAITWSQAGERISAQAAYGWRRWTIDELHGDVGIGSLRTLPGLPPALAGRLAPADGRLQIAVGAVEARNGRVVALRGMIVGASLSWRGRERWDLGDLRLTFDGNATAPLQGEIIDLAGPLEIRARLRIDSPPAWNLSGTVRARDPAWAPRLRVFGAPDPQGRHVMSVEGR